MDVILDALQRCLPLPASRRDGLGILHIDVVSQTVPRQRPVHRPGIHPHEAQRLRHQSGVGALAAGAGAVDRDDYRMLGFRHATTPEELQGYMSYIVT